MASDALSTPARRAPLSRHTESEADMFRRWEAAASDRGDQIEKTADADLEVDNQIERLFAEQADFEILILSTPATCREAILVKARLGRLDRFRDVDEAGQALFTQIIDHLAAGDDRERGGRYAPDKPGSPQGGDGAKTSQLTRFHNRPS